MSNKVFLEEFNRIEGDWEQSLAHCFTNTIFVTPWFQRIWWRVFGDGSQLRILTVRDGESVIGIAPMLLSDGTLTFLGGSDLFDYHDFLVPKGNEQRFFETLFDHIGMMEWDTIDLRSVPQDSPTICFVSLIGEQMGYSLEVVKEDVVPFLDLPSTWDQYVGELPKKSRHELRRKIRRLENEGVVKQYSCTDDHSVREGMQQFFHLHKISRPDKKLFMNRDRERFFLDIALELADKGQLHLAMLELDGKCVASCISFDYLGSRLLYNSGYDPEYSNLSVGFVNKAFAIKEAISDGKHTFNFLRGAERYKYDLGAKDSTVYRLVLRR